MWIEEQKLLQSRPQMAANRPSTLPSVPRRIPARISARVLRSLPRLRSITRKRQASRRPISSNKYSDSAFGQTRRIHPLRFGVDTAGRFLFRPQFRGGGGGGVIFTTP